MGRDPSMKGADYLALGCLKTGERRKGRSGHSQRVLMGALS